MTNAVKNKEEGKGKGKEGLLLATPKGTFKQDKVDGSGTLKATAPKEVREACEHFFSKREDLACAKSNEEKAREKILSTMRQAKITLVKVRDNNGVPRTIQITAEEKLKIGKDLK